MICLLSISFLKKSARKSSEESIVHIHVMDDPIDLPDPIPHRKPISLRKHAELVLARVELLGTTTMSELIDYLIDLRRQEEDGPLTKAQQQGIQRRVYDIINVLLEVGVIAQDKRTIRWLGLPNPDADAVEEERLVSEKQKILKDIEKARDRLAGIHAEILLFSALSARNIGFIHSDEILSLPFLTITTQQELTTILSARMTQNVGLVYLNRLNYEMIWKSCGWSINDIRWRCCLDDV